MIPKPNEAVISADKMNVVYKGLTNPMTISIPGIPSNKVTASAPGLTKKERVVVILCVQLVAGGNRCNYYCFW